MNRYVFGWVLLSTAVYPGQASAQDGPESVTRGTKQFRKNVLVSGLAGPWELTWGPDNMLWVTERTGKRVTRIDPATGNRSVAITIEEVSAPGGQDGLLGMAMHPELLRGTGQDFVYVAYTYVDEKRGPNPTVRDPKSPYRYLYGKIVRLAYNKTSGTLSDPVDLIAGLPASNDHDVRTPQDRPGQKALLHHRGRGATTSSATFASPSKHSASQPRRVKSIAGTIPPMWENRIRLNLDGSIPADNPEARRSRQPRLYLRSPQTCRASTSAPMAHSMPPSRGPKTDDEVNILQPGANYGWPHVAGVRDGKAYVYARWAEASTPCARTEFRAIWRSIRPCRASRSRPLPNPSWNRSPPCSPSRATTISTIPRSAKASTSSAGPPIGASSIEYYPSQGEGHSRHGTEILFDYHPETRVALRLAADSRWKSRGRSYVPLLPVGEPLS